MNKSKIPVLIGPAWSQLQNPSDYLIVSPWLSVPQSGFGFAGAFETNVCFLRKKDLFFPTGLLSVLMEKAQENGYQVEPKWTEAAKLLPIVTDLPEIMPNGLPPRDYQYAIVDEACRVGRGIIKAATGSGKTGMMAMILYRFGVPKTLVIVPSRVLVRQTREEIASWLGLKTAQIGEVSGTRANLNADVVVGLSVSLISKAQRMPDVVRLLRETKVLFLDEAHHVNLGGKPLSPKSGQWFRLAMSCMAPIRFGFSATPLKPGNPVQNWRLAGATGPLLSCGISASDLMAEGFGAVSYIYYLRYALSRPRRRYLSYREAVNAGIVHCATRNEAIFRAGVFLSRDMGLKVLILVEHLDHLDILYNMFDAESGITCFSLMGTMDQGRQEQVLHDFRSYRGGCICVATRVLGEGTNVKDIDVVIFAAGGKSPLRLMQAIGRGMRVRDDKNKMLFIDLDDSESYSSLARHFRERRVALAAEPGFRIAAEGQELEDFVRAVWREE